jgi:hypothetical protein
MSKNTNNNYKKDVCFSTPKSSTLFKLSDFEGKKVEVCFGLEETSSDGGLLLLRHDVQRSVDSAFMLDVVFITFTCSETHNVLR